MKTAPFFRRSIMLCCLVFFSFALLNEISAQTLAFPGAEGFGRFAKGARGAATRSVYIVTNLNDAGAGSFRDAVSQPGRIVVFAVGGIVRLSSDIVVSPNITIAGQTAPGDGIVFVNKRVTFSGASNTIARFLRIRLGATGNSGKDASGIANGAQMIFDHMSFTWGMDEVFSINWDNKGSSPDSITIQRSIIGQGLHRENHSAGGLIQTPDGGKISLLRNLYISNKTRNPKVKGVNEFVNNVVYNWGNGNRLDTNMNKGWEGDAYIMGGSSGVSEVNVINNYFMAAPLTDTSRKSPFSRGTGTFNIHAAGNYYDKNKNGVLDGSLVPFDSIGYPGITGSAFQASPYAYPQAHPVLTAQQAYQWIIDSVGPNYPRRDQVDQFLVNEVASRGTQGHYVYRETDMPLANGGVGNVFGAPAPADSDNDGMPDAWEDANGLNANNAADAVLFSTSFPQYLNIEVYINGLINTPPASFLAPPTNLVLSATTVDVPAPKSKVAITWTDNSATENAFLIQRSANGGSYATIMQTAANITAHTDSAGLSPNTLYYYRVRAANATDTSAYSAPVQVTTPPLPSAPTVPANPSPSNGFQYVELASGNAVLKWTGSTNTVKYEVYFGTSAATLVKQADVPYVAAPSYTKTALSPNNNYYWRVDAVNANGTATGNVWSFRTTTIIPPSLVGFWAFDETTGRDVIDSTTFQNHGVLGLDDDDTTIRTTGKVNRGVDFATADPNLYVVSIPHQDQLYLDKGSFSLSYWMKAPIALMPTGSTTSAYLLCKGSITKNATTGATGKRFNIEFKSSQLRFAIDDDNDAGGGGKDELQTDAVPFFNDQWNHVVVIRDTTTKKLRAFLNGALVKEQAITKAFSGIGEASDLVVGNIGELEFLSTTNTPAPYKGKLDELKIFNYAISDSQILKLFHTSPLPVQPFSPSPASGSVSDKKDSVKTSWRGGINTAVYKVYLGTNPGSQAFVSNLVVTDPGNFTFTGLVENTTYYWRIDAVNGTDTVASPVWSFKTAMGSRLVGHWKLDETTGTIAADSSGFNNHGTLTGMATAAWTAAGKFGGSLAYGTPVATGAVVVPNADQILFDNNGFTISMWVKISSNTYLSSGSKDCYLLHKGTFEATTGKWYGLQLRDSKLTFAIDDGVTKNNIDFTIPTSGVNNLFSNTWKHIVAVKETSPKVIRLYIDGVQVLQGNYTAGTLGRPTSSLLIGNSTENKPYRDLMDDIRMYNYPLDATGVATLFAGGDPSLPVNLLTFNAAIKNNTVALTWQTAAEQNSDRFEVLHSTDGQHFSLVGSVPAAGNSNTARMYSITHQQPVKGINYYQLIQYDKDGRKTVHGVRAVRMGAGKVQVAEIYPNPAAGWFNLLVNDYAGEQIQVSIADMHGRIVSRQTLAVANGGGVFKIVPASQLAPGSYKVLVYGKQLNEALPLQIK